MNPFLGAHSKIVASSHYDAALRFVAPLKDFLGIGHFWFYKISNSGNYSYFGTHMNWNEYCYGNSMHEDFTCLRHPDTQTSGMSLMKNTSDGSFKSVIDTAWQKYKINFSVNLQEKTADGIEAFGFATAHKNDHSDGILLNELDLLRAFTKSFRQQNQKLFGLLEDNQVDLSPYLGEKFYRGQAEQTSKNSRALFLRQLGVSPHVDLSKREKEILQFMLHGYPVSYVAMQLGLSDRTVESYILSLKNKLNCSVKLELIEKAKELQAFGYFDSIFLC